MRHALAVVFIFAVLWGLPGGLLWLFGGWTCLGVFAGYLALDGMVCHLLKTDGAARWGP